MSDTRHLTLKVNELGFGEVLLDGMPVHNCRATTIESVAGDVTRVTLEIINVEVEFSGPAFVTSVDVTPGKDAA